MSEDGVQQRSPKLRAWALKAIGSAVVLAVLFMFVPGAEVLAGLARISFWVFALVALCFGLGHVVAALKWWILIGRPVGAGVAVRAHFAGLAANLCMPGVAGGDALRAGMIFHRVEDRAKLIAGSLVDRLIDSVALAALALLGLAMMRGDAASPLAFSAIAAVLFVGLPLAVFVLIPAGATAIVRRFPDRRGMQKLAGLSDAISQQRRRPGLLTSMTFLSVAIQGLFLGLAGWIAFEIGVDVSAGAWLYAWTLAKLIATLPISLGGLGVRELSLAALLAPFGADQASVVAASLGWQGVLFLAGAFGALTNVAYLGSARWTARHDQGAGQ